VDGTVKLWQLPVTQGPIVLIAAGRAQFTLAVPGGRLLAVTETGKVQRWDLDGCRELPGADAAAEELVRRKALALGPGGKRLATLGPDGVCVWDTDESRSLFSFPCLNRGEALAAAFSPDGAILAVAGSEKERDHRLGVVRFWDLATGQEARSPLLGHRDRVTAVAYAADGRTLATGHPDGMVKLWDLAGGEEKVTFRVRGGGLVLCVAFDADDSTLGAVSQPPDGPARIHFWRAASPAEVRRSRSHTPQPGEAP
jgi:WD40 repeat protein